MSYLRDVTGVKMIEGMRNEEVCDDLEMTERALKIKLWSGLLEKRKTWRWYGHV